MKAKITNVEDIPLAFNPEMLAQILGISRAKGYLLAQLEDFIKIRMGKRVIIEKESFLAWLNSKVGSDIL